MDSPTFEPIRIGLPEMQGRGDEANDATVWRKRGRLLAEKSVAEWPFVDWKIAAAAASCFTIAQGLTDADQVEEPKP